jgi:hypothetical protein
MLVDLADKVAKLEKQNEELLQSVHGLEQAVAKH